MADKPSNVLNKTRSFFLVIIMSYIILMIISFILGQFGWFAISIGRGFLILIAAVILAMATAGIRDFRIDSKEIWYFALVVGTLFATWFLMKQYIPEIFSIFPESSQQVFTQLNSVIKLGG